MSSGLRERLLWKRKGPSYSEGGSGFGREDSELDDRSVGSRASSTGSRGRRLLHENRHVPVWTDDQLRAHLSRDEDYGAFTREDSSFRPFEGHQDGVIYSHGQAQNSTNDPEEEEEWGVGLALKSLLNLLLPPVGESLNWVEKWWNRKSAKGVDPLHFYSGTLAATLVGAGVGGWLLASSITPDAGGEKLYEFLHQQASVAAMVMIVLVLMWVCRAIGFALTAANVKSAKLDDPHKLSTVGALMYGLFGAPVGDMHWGKNGASQVKNEEKPRDAGRGEYDSVAYHEPYNPYLDREQAQDGVGYIPELSISRGR